MAPPAGWYREINSFAMVLFPDPTRNDPARNYANNQPVDNDNNNISSRIDYEFSPRTKLFGNYSISYVDGALGVIPAPLGIAANSAEDTRDASRFVPQANVIKPAEWKAGSLPEAAGLPGA